MDVSPFKQDIDDLIDEFAQVESTTLADMKRVWLSRKMSYIYEASPSSNLAFFMQSLYAHSIEELKKLKNLVVDAKEINLKVVSALVKRMLEKNMFLFGFVDINEGSISETVNQLTELQNARIQVAYKELFGNTRIEDFLHMDMGMEVDLDVLKKMSTEYAEAKKLAISGASQVVDVENIKHIAEDSIMVGDAVEKITEEWNVQKQLFYEQTGLNRQLQGEYNQQKQLLLLQDGDDSYSEKLEQFLSETS